MKTLYVQLVPLAREQHPTSSFKRGAPSGISLSNKHGHLCARIFLSYNKNPDQDVTSNDDLSHNLLYAFKATKRSIYIVST